jgi:3-oxoacyl-[acyl-carrier-protein] synthase II
MGRRRVVVTGMGWVTCLGTSLEGVLEALLAGRSGISTISRFDTKDFDVHIGGEIKDFAPETVLDARLARRMDRFAQFAMVASTYAVTDSGLDVSALDPMRVGVCVGSGIGGLQEIESQHSVLLERGPGRISPFMIPKLMANAAAGQISILYGVRGPNSATSTACASGANAIGDAGKIIGRGEADVMIAGGTEAALTPMGLAGFCALKALSTRNDRPEAASRPFDRDRDGFVLSEGAGILILEELEHARKRGARLYAELVGYGMSGDGSHITAPDAEGRGAALAIRNALADAHLNPSDIDYINAHGTGTGLGDASETRAMHAVFGDQAPRIPVSSTKSMIGHLLGAAGGVELIATVLMMNRGVVHPTANLEHPDPECDLDYIPGQARELKIRAAISNSFGFGGHNVTLVVKPVTG